MVDRRVSLLGMLMPRLKCGMGMTFFLTCRLGTTSDSGIAGVAADVVPEGCIDGGVHSRRRAEAWEERRAGVAVALGAAAMTLPTVNWAPSSWSDVPSEEVLGPLDLVCLGGTVMLAFHFAGQTARRPTPSQRSTMADLLGELGLGGKYRKLERKDLAALVSRVKTDLYNMRQEMKSIHAMPEDEVWLVQRKLQALQADMTRVAVPAQIGGAFARIDENGDGMIDREDLAKILQNLGSRTWSDAEIATLFRAADVNQDGRLDFMEFVNMIFEGGEAQNAIAGAVGGDTAPGPPLLQRSKSGRRERRPDGTITYVHCVRAPPS